MVESVTEIWSAIKDFRQSDYLLHVIRQRSIELNKSTELKGLLTLSDSEFLDEMRAFLASLPMLEERTIDPVLNGNTVQEIRNAFSNIFDDEITKYDALAGIWRLSGSGPYFSTYVFAIVTNGGYILYHHTLLEGMRDIFPELVEGINRVRTIDDYLKFMSVCLIVAEVFRLSSLAELHEFLWHGNNTNWAFEDYESEDNA